MVCALALMALLVGCEAKTDDSDLPPQIVAASADDGDVIRLFDEFTTVWVQIYDEDPNSLAYAWSVGGTPLEHTLTNGGSQVLIQKNDSYDGVTLQCVVSDYSNETKIDWPLQIQD
jgi:hypothetical protein